MRTPNTRLLHGARPVTQLTDIALGAAIRDRRGRLGLHLEALAARAGIDHRVLSRLERGERPCRFTEFVAIAGALNMCPDALMQMAFGHGPTAA